MSIYENMGNKQMNPQQMLNSLRNNPAALLKQRGYTIPDGMTNPQQIIQHLISSGQVPQSRYAQALQMLRR